MASWSEDLKLRPKLCDLGQVTQAFSSPVIWEMWGNRATLVLCED